jgi:hypothetical protein
MICKRSQKRARCELTKKLHLQYCKSPEFRYNTAGYTVLHGPPPCFSKTPSFIFKGGGLRPHFCLKDEFSSFYRQNSKYNSKYNFQNFSPAAG